MFIAQVYGIELSAWQQFRMLGMMFIASKGMAGVPRASLVVVAATLGSLNIPEAGLLLVLAVDQFLDMGRSATNVVGNAVAAAVVDKWEGAGRADPDAPESPAPEAAAMRSEEHTSELQSLMRISYAVFCLKKKNTKNNR